MKIKDILANLLPLGDIADFSDHAMKRVGEGERGWEPMHGFSDKCTFCDAWREALSLIAAPVPAFLELPENGAPVWLPGRVPGRIMGTEITVRVEVQGGEYGPWAVGAFRPSEITPRDTSTPEFTSWRSPSGDIWEREESTLKMRRTSRATGTWKPGEKLQAWEDVTIHFAHVENIAGELERIS